MRCQRDPFAIAPYLSDLRTALTGLEPTEVDEIVRELESHLIEKAAKDGEWAAVAAMGNPHELAAIYLEQRVPRPERSSSSSESQCSEPFETLPRRQRAPLPVEEALGLAFPANLESRANDESQKC